ncbi:unnamed protein product (macronuclear) [Paramecium tetraurelia]|uniref:RING-type domain-containing protein n=1 Tax=Paramecium tetraurelia TaxID=5888 RepID=A0DWU5_PARTE|nr:uncharacterized protein GSPATT00021155001 [Paramecium tetraurelia]CAK87512.1 unnamed protein product [Paramecium tetraurelia]|eukprot:XP_001454909.1 hypothetical protein (macronuclear) [Paramecium tetraurelia strain d4-2]
MFFVSYCLAQIVEVKFNQQQRWSSEFKNSTNNTFRIAPLDKVEQFYYIQIELNITNPKFMLLAQKNYPISNPFSPMLLDGENIDATNQYENRDLRYLKIASIDQPIYITTLGEGVDYKISVEKSENQNICQNQCSNHGDCQVSLHLFQKQGCFCLIGYTGIDCSQNSTPIIDNMSIPGNQNEKTYFSLLYLPTTSLQGYQYTLKFKTNNYVGLQIIVYKTSAIINPLKQLISDPNLCDIYQVSKNKELELLLRVPEIPQQRNRLNFAIKTAFPDYLMQDLEISLQEYVEEEVVDLSDTMIIIISIGCVVFVSLIIMFFCYRQYKKKQAAQRRMIMQNQEPLHSGHENHPIIQQEINLEEVCQKNCLCKLSSKELNPEEYCSICLEPLDSAQEVRQTRCHHNFHIKCIKLWLEKAKHECPICRQQLELKPQDEIMRT